MDQGRDSDRESRDLAGADSAAAVELRGETWEVLILDAGIAAWRNLAI
jgi:hypothetical protein